MYSELRGKSMFFRLKSYIYATHCDSGIVILDLKRDKYFSLTDEAVDSFIEILSHDFVLKNDSYKPVSSPENDEEHALHSWIHYFLEQDFIEQVPNKDLSKPLRTAHIPGGLADYQWDTKDKLSSFSQSSKMLVTRFLFLLTQVEFILKRKGIQGILNKIEKYKRLHTAYRIPSQEEIQMFSSALDVAGSLYPKKIYCLAWASTFVLMALKKGLECNLVIGVQSPPFYAHAWAQIGDDVINDAAIVKECLSILLKEPFGQG